MIRYNYTDEQRKHAKNLNVSANIYNQDIKKLQAELDVETDVAKQAILASKIQDKQAKRQIKLDELAVMRAAAAYEYVAPPKPIKVKEEPTGTVTTPELTEVPTDL